MIGIYVDRWRIGTHSEKEIDGLLSFCDDAGIEDIYLHSHEDIAVSDNWDYLGHALTNAGKKRIHIWLSLTLGRDNQHTRDKAEDMKLITDRKSVTLSKETEQGAVLSLNPESKSAQKYFIERFSEKLLSNPNLYGIHLDKLDEKSEWFVNEVRQRAPTKYLSMTIRKDDTTSEQWNLDERIPLIMGFTHQQADEDYSKYKSVVLSCFACNVATTTERIKKIQAQGVTPLLYSYGAFSSSPFETHSDFLQAIKNVTKL